MGQTIISFDQNLQKILENTMSIKPYQPLKKIDQNFAKGQCGPNRFVLALKILKSLYKIGELYGPS